MRGAVSGVKSMTRAHYVFNTSEHRIVNYIRCTINQDEGRNATDSNKYTILNYCPIIGPIPFFLGNTTDNIKCMSL